MCTEVSATAQVMSCRVKDVTERVQMEAVVASINCNTA
jgi:hypothetical protein